MLFLSFQLMMGKIICRHSLACQTTQDTADAAVSLRTLAIKAVEQPVDQPRRQFTSTDRHAEI